MAERISETIVAIATPLGKGGLGVIRLSGSTSLSVASSLFHPSTHLSHAKSHTLHHGWIVSGGKKVDEVVAGFFKGPNSYTGEDVVELSCHGSPTVLKEVVELCQSQGARLARPGEFTERAFLNGKMDLAQAEAVADLISANSSRARKTAIDQLLGELSGRIKSIRQPLVDLVAQMEANLDFVEEDIPNLPPKELKTGLKKIKDDIEKLLSTSLRGHLVRHGLRIAIVGRPNVGKSSLFNALLAQDRAIVTEVAGTTRDTLEESLEWNTYPIVLTDTAGLRQTKDQVEKKGTERTRRALNLADVAVFVLDGSEDLTAEDKTVFGEIKHKKIIAVLNKSDKKVKIKKDPLIQLIGSSPTIPISAKLGEGLEDLKDEILKSIGMNTKEIENAPVLTNMRHVHHLEKAAEKIRHALKSMDASHSEESISIDLRAALTELGAITGEDINEDILSSIFGRFCIGK